jgi:hypothetical protein
MSGMLGVSLLLLAHLAVADPSVRQRATEEIAPGVRVRGGAVAIELDPPHCDPPCEDGTHCQEICRNGECDARSSADNPCHHCTWECAESATP